MSLIPPQWGGDIQGWMRQVANAVNPLVKKWPNLTTPGAIGYEVGAGGTVTQATSKATNVTLNKSCGDITLNNANLVTGTTVSFGFINSVIEAGDQLILSHSANGTIGAYVLNGRCFGGFAAIDVTNRGAVDLAEAIVIRFSILKGSTS